MTQNNSMWWSDFFTGLTADSVRLLSHPAQTKAEADFLEHALAIKAGCVIADVPCGDGRIARELARRGYRLRGLDISAELIAAARAASQDQTAFVIGDMRQLPWHDELDGAFCFGNSFAYFDDAGNREFLSSMRTALKRDAPFVLQTHLLAESILSRPLTRSWYEFPDLLFLHEPSYDPRAASLTSRYTLLRGDRREDKVAHYRIYLLREVIGLFEACGFTVESVRAGLTAEPYTLGAPSAIIVAKAR